MHMPDHSEPGEQLLDFLPRQWARRIMLIVAEHLIAKENLVNTTITRAPGTTGEESACPPAIVAIQLSKTISR
jgi:hypothetical protein